MDSIKSIYTHSEDHIRKFEELCEDFLSQLPKAAKTLHSNYDQKSSVFNMWLQLIDCPTFRIPKHDIMIFHELTIAYHFYISNHKITQMLKEYHYSPETMFIYAYFVSLYLNEYILDEIDADTVTMFKEKIKNQSFFTLTDEYIEKTFGKQVFNIHRELHYRLVNDEQVKRIFFDFLLKAYNDTINVIEKKSLYELK